MELTRSFIAIAQAAANQQKQQLNTTFNIESQQDLGKDEARLNSQLYNTKTSPTLATEEQE
jgi:hypothetical protein